MQIRKFELIQSFSLFLKIAVIFYALFSLSCGGGTSGNQSDGGTGSVSLDLVWHTGAAYPGDDALRRAAALVLNDDGTIDCEASRADTIYVAVYDQTSDEILSHNGDGWACTDHHGVVDNVPAGNGRKVVSYVYDASKAVLYRGQESDVEVFAGTGADGRNRIQVEMHPFTGVPTSPQDDATVNTDTPAFECQEVQGANGYHFQVAGDIGFETLVDDQTSATSHFQAGPIAVSGTYYWRVCAVDSYDVAGKWSTPRRLNVSLAPQAATHAATFVTASTAILNGTVNARGLASGCYFEYGTSTDYGTVTAEQDIGAGTQSMDVAETIAGLSSETTYHYRLVSTNDGGTAYGQDGSFSTPDVTSPTITGVTPADGAINVGVNSQVRVAFSEPMDGSTLTAATFFISDGTADIAGTIEYTDSTALFQPASSLHTDTTYTVTVTAAVRDQDGLALTQDYLWSFTTTETVPPSVVAASLYPQNNARGVGLYPTISAAFSEPMDPSTIIVDSFVVQDGTAAIAGTVAYDDQTMTAFFVPDQNLPCDTLITVILTTQMTDLAGNSIAAETQWQFTTTDRCGAHIAAGRFHAAALKADGTLWTWGENDYGQLGNGTQTYDDTPARIDDSNDWALVAAGDRHTVALKTNGTLWAWGDNFYGQLGDGTNTHSDSPIQIGDRDDWALVTTGGLFTIALRYDGTLWAWGMNDIGQLGIGTASSTNMPIQIQGSNAWDFVDTGIHHTIALRQDGTLWAWGDNSNGQLGDGTTTNKTVPTQIGDSQGWGFAAAGWDFSMALNDGTIWAWGDNSNGQLGDGTSTDRYVPTPIGGDNDWVALASGSFHSLALNSDGTLWSWGDNAHFQLGDDTTANKNNPTLIGDGNDWHWSAVAAGERFSLGLMNDGTLWAWGRYRGGLVVEGSTIDAIITPTLVADRDPWHWASVAAGGDHNLSLMSDGTLWAWGQNDFGEVGDGTSVNKKIPVLIDADNNWDIIKGGSSRSIATMSDGTLWAWGNNFHGNFGDGTTIHRNVPAQTGEDSDWDFLSAGGFSTIALKTDGTLWTWGDNSNGQLGNGTNSSLFIPTPIGDGTDWAYVASGGRSTFALQSDNSLWAWGSNSLGELGDGTTSDRWVPTQIGQGYEWTLVDVYSYHTLALRSDGTLWAWGRNYYGQLGDGTNTNQNMPVQIGDGSDWVSVATGAFHSIALKADGTLWAWGDNNDGQLGDATNTDKNVPTQIGDGNDWAFIDAGYDHTIALKTNGTLWVWGDNANGQIGDGTYQGKNVPTQSKRPFRLF